MRKIGYIHRYSLKEKKGILVYGYNKGPFWNIPKPILFEKKQCEGTIKTGALVYFDINEANIVSNIQIASIYNFDREVLLSYVIKDGNNQWYDGERSTHICYQNISELREWIPFETYSTPKTPKNDLSDSDEDSDEILTLLSEDELNILYDNNPKGKYEKIALPKSIEDEFKLFTQQFTQIYDDFFHEWQDLPEKGKQIIIIDILDPKYWIPLIVNSKRHYYGKTANELKDLLDILILKRRNAETFQDDSISQEWSKLLNKLPPNDLIEVHNFCKLIQPLLPESFCYKFIDLLDENYGFPTVSVAEWFLHSKVKSVYNATGYNHYKDLVNRARNCKVKHIPEEGVPFCAIDKKKLKNISISLGRKKNKILTFIEKQIRTNSSDTELAKITNYINSRNVELMLKIGEFYDSITEISNHPCLIYLQNDKIVESYNELPQETYALLDQYLHNELNRILLESLKKGYLSPFSLHNTLEELAWWIDDSFLKRNANVIRTVFLKTADIEDLNDAFKYGYISNDDYALSIKKHIDELTIWQLAKFITEPYHKMSFVRFDKIPVKTQKYALIHLVTLYNSKELDKGESVRISEFNSFYNLKDFIRWLTELKSGQYGHIDQNAIEFAINKAIEPLCIQDIQLLYKEKCLVRQGEKINTWLNEYFHQLEDNMRYQEYRDSLYDDNLCNRYAGSWAQDVEGYSDDDIDTIFDGDPSAYWNID